MKTLKKTHTNVNVETYKKPNSSSCTTCANGCYTGSSTLLVGVRSRIKS